VQRGLVGGFEAGYNWQWSNWLLGFETDFSFAGMSATASGTSRPPLGQPFVQTTTAQQNTDWYGTVRWRAGWLATPNLLLFGTGGFAYGRVSDSANWVFTPGPAAFAIGIVSPTFAGSVACTATVPCFAGNSTAIRTGWTAGGGLEWLLDQRWSAKVEYQFVDLGSQTVRIVGTPATGLGLPPSTFNAAFHDRFNVVRLGLNYKFWC
jgi:outer membrane immunogenic protein